MPPDHPAGFVPALRAHWRILWRPQSLWHRLLRLALIACVPLAVIAGVGVGTLLLQQQREAERTALEFTRAFANTIEADLDRAIAVLGAMSTSPLLDHDGVEDFLMLSERVLATLPDWRAIHLAEPQGRVVAYAGHDEPPAALQESPTFRRVVEERRPVVGILARIPAGWGIPVRYPVVRNGELRYVLTGVLKTDAILKLVERQRVPGDWIVSVFDATNRRLARSRDHSAALGTAPAPSLAELMASAADEGTGVTLTLEGDRVYTAYVRLPNAGWTVAAGISTEAHRTAQIRSLLLWGGGVALSLLLGTLLALIYAGGINRPIARLADAARSLGAGTTPMPLPRAGIGEVDAVADALVEAGLRRRQSESEREAARAEAETANRAKDEFLAMLGHELRNPLAPIVTAVELMKRRHPGAAERERSIIERQVGHLRRLVDDLLDVSRIVRHKLQLERRPTDLQHVLDKAIETVEPAFAGRTPLSVQRVAGPVIVDGDDVRLTQVVCNLLVNAAKFTLPQQAVRLGLALDGSEAVIEVADEGAGIAGELLPHVFDLFVQGPQSLDRRSGGLGLGLGIVKGLVEMHGGRVAAASDGPGHGSRFTVRLPLAQAGAPEAAAPAAAAAAPQPALRVLVVDDNVDAAQALGELLRAAGHAVREAHDAMQALAVLDEFVPEVALLDIGLPGLSGYDLAAVLRGDPRLAGMALIALTGYGREPDRARAIAGGFDEHLVKPVGIDTLFAAIARCAPTPLRKAG